MRAHVNAHKALQSIAVGRLQVLCERWGGALVRCTATQWQHAIANSECSVDAVRTKRHLVLPLEPCPFDVGGISYDLQIVYVPTPMHVSSVIHEMGHVFASSVAPDHRDCEEIDWLGWEMAVAHHLGIYEMWSDDEYMQTYHLGEDLLESVLGSIYHVPTTCEWRDLNSEEQRLVMLDRLAYAQTIGVVSQLGEPLSIRR